MKKRKKLSARILSLLLMVALMCSMLPAGVFAAGNTAVVDPVGTVAENAENIQDKNDPVLLDNTAVTSNDKLTEDAESKNPTIPDNSVIPSDSEAKASAENATPSEDTASVTNPDYSYDEKGNLIINTDKGTAEWRNDKTIDKEQVVSVIIEEEVNSISDGAFKGCTNLTGVILRDEKTPPALGVNVFEGMPLWFSIIVPTDTSIDIYKNADGWKDYASHIVYNRGGWSFEKETGTLYIYINKAFTDWKANVSINPKEVRNLVIRNTANNIPDDAFSNCVNLEKVTVLSFLQSIGESAFEGCSSLTDFEMPESVATIGDKAFKDTKISNIEIPAKAEIGESAFENCTKLSEIILPAGISKISASTFKGCTGLNIAMIPHTVSSIGDEAFSGCSALENILVNTQTPASLGIKAFDGLPEKKACIMVPKEAVNKYKDLWSDYKEIICALDTGYTFENGTLTVTANAGTVLWRTDESIGEENVQKIIIQDTVDTIIAGAFQSCKNLTEVELSNKVTTIGEKAFRRCVNLTSVRLPNSVTRIESEAFSSCDNLVSINIPEGLTTIEKETFYGCDNLASIDIPFSVVTIGDSAFEFCVSLTEISIPENVKNIDAEAFKHCRALKNVDLPNGLKTLGVMAFAYNTSLDSILIPEQITHIEKYTFLGCTALDFVSIPSSVTSIGTSAFGDTNSLKTVLVTRNIPATMQDSAFGMSLPEGAEIFVPTSSVEAYKKANYWMNYAANITGFENGYEFDQESGKLTIKTELGAVLWKENGNNIKPEDIQHLVILDTVQTIPEEAFDGCTNLKTAEIANSVTTIDSHAFSGCTSLTAINLPVNLETIGWGAFSDCNNSALSEIIIPANVKTIGNYVFLGCTNVKTFVVKGETPAKLGGRAFDVDRTDFTILVPTGKLATYQTAWSVYADQIKAVEEKVAFLNLSANGASGTATTTELTLSFDKDIQALTESDITLIGAAKGTLEKGSKTGEYKLSISGITVKNGDTVTVKVDKAKEGYLIEPGSRNASVSVKQPAPGPTPSPNPNNGGGNVKTGVTDTQTGAACAAVFLGIAGLAALGFKRRFNK